MTREVTVKAPGKLMIMGEHAVVYGYPCLVTAVNKYISVKAGISNNKTDNISVGNSDDRFVRSALSVFRNKYSVNNKVTITTFSEIGRYGLGSSAAVTVAAVKALAELFEIKIGKQDLFNLSYKALLKIQKKASGFDLAASIFGGTIFFDGKTKQIEKIAKESLPLVGAFSGVKADTVTMVNQVVKLRMENKNQVEHIFRCIADLVMKAKEAIIRQNWKYLGELFYESQKLLVRLRVSTTKIDMMIEAAMDAGAYGAKISGAGGGDCIIALVLPDKKIVVEKALIKAGAEVLDIKTGVKGVQTVNF